MEEDKNKPETIFKNSGENKDVAKEAQESKGLYEVTYLKDHGNKLKDQKAEMHLSTAKALKAHKIVEIGDQIKVVKKKKR